jgi:hypothetical protein
MSKGKSKKRRERRQKAASHLYEEVVAARAKAATSLPGPTPEPNQPEIQSQEQVQPEQAQAIPAPTPEALPEEIQGGAPIGGIGGVSESEPALAPESGLKPYEENRLTATAIRNRWPITEKHKQAAVGVTIRNMARDDGRVSNGAVRNLLAMEAQQMEQEKRDSGETDAPTVNVQINQLLPQLAAMTPEQIQLLKQECHAVLDAEQAQSQPAHASASTHHPGDP